nr:conserved hypothetical protein [Serratia symbiotica]
MTVAASQTQKPVIKQVGQDKPMYNPDNAQYRLWGRDLKGWGHLNMAHQTPRPAPGAHGPLSDTTTI